MSSMILDGLCRGILAIRSSRYEAPEGLMQAVTSDISKMLLGWNFLSREKAKSLSIWKMPYWHRSISFQTF